MASLVDQVRHDIASLEQLVFSVADLCEHPSATASYAPATEGFFLYVVSIARATRDYLRAFPAHRTSDPEYLGFRREVAELRGGWQSLHGFARAVLAADTLHQPSSLVQGLVERFQQLAGFPDTNFVIYHTDQFNYFNFPVVEMRRLGRVFERLLKVDPFPEKLGVIGIPYSQAASIFPNCLIAHEMGHYVFRNRQLNTSFQQASVDELDKRLSTQVPGIIRQELGAYFSRWLEEVFCDLFALRLIGFCFSFAYIESFDLASILDANGHLSAAGTVGVTDFSDYPPDVFRLKQHARLLKSDGWWPRLKLIGSHYVDVLEAADSFPDSGFQFDAFATNQYVLAPQVSESFLSVLPLVTKELDIITRGISPCLDSWVLDGELIEAYLEYGVVPSSLNDPDNPKRAASPAIPSTEALLNASYRFYAESLNKLLEHIEGASPDSIADRSKWAKKVQMWTAKAIEDAILLRGAKGNGSIVRK